ncbi:enolase-phosphatase E1-like [Clytia hemisphaerica]
MASNEDQILDSWILEKIAHKTCQFYTESCYSCLARCVTIWKNETNEQTIPRLKEYAVIIDLINQSFEPDDSSSLQKLLGMINDEFKNSKHSEKIKEYIKIVSSAEKQDNGNIQSHLKKLVKQFLKEQQKPKLDTFMSVLLDEREKQRSTQHGGVEEGSQEAIPKSTMKRKRTRLISQSSSEEGGSERNSGNISSQTSKTKAVNNEDDDDESQSMSRDEGHTRILRSRPQKIQGYQNKIRKRNSRSSPKPTNTLESSNPSDAKETSKEIGTQKRTLVNDADQQLIEEKTARKNSSHKRSLQRNALQEIAGTDVIDDRSPKRSAQLINKMDKEESNQKATQKSPKIRSSEVNHDEGDKSDDDEDLISLHHLQQNLQQKIASSPSNGQVNPVNQKQDHQKSLEDKVDENSCDSSLRGDRQPVTEDVDILSNSLMSSNTTQKSSDEMSPISVSQQHVTEESNSSSTQRLLVEVSSTRTLRSRRLQDAEQLNAKPSQNPPEKLSSVTNDEIDDDDEQEILREIEDELNSITTSMFSKMGEHFNEDPRDIEARFNDAAKRMSPYINASEENDVNASAENDDKRQKKNAPNGKPKAKSDQTKQRQTMAVQPITYTSKRKSLYGSPKKLLLTTSNNKPSSPKKKRLQNTSTLELCDSQKESPSPKSSTKCSERERNSSIIKRKTNCYHGDLDHALTQDEQDTDAGRNATSRNQNNSPVSLARTSRKHDRYVSYTRSPNKRKSQPESSPISSRGGRTGSQPSSSREDVNNTRMERHEEMQEEGESVQWDSIVVNDDVDDDNNRNRRVGNRDVTFKKKSARVKFQAYEEKSLIAGIERFGVGDWNNILKHFKFHESRTNVALKDKYRTMKRQGLIQ